MKNINFNINLKFILILNLIILISSILIYYLYQNKNFIDFLKKQLPSDDIQIKNQITSVEDIYGKKSTKAPKPPSPPPTIPSPPKPPSPPPIIPSPPKPTPPSPTIPPPPPPTISPPPSPTIPPSPPPIIPSPPKPPTIQPTPTEIDDELQENINDAVKNVIDNINNFHQKCITDYTNELNSKMQLFTNIIENKYNELFVRYSNLEDIPLENKEGKNYCDRYIKQIEKLNNSNKVNNNILDECKNLKNFIIEKKKEFNILILNHKNKLKNTKQNIEKYMNILNKNYDNYLLKSNNIKNDINNLDIDFTLLDDINKTKQELENKKLLILEENKKIQNFLSKELISDKNDKIYNYENNMELMEHCFGGTDMCSNMGCNVRCPINTTDSDDVIENCYYKEGEEKDFIENHRFIYKNVYGEVLKNNPKIYY